MDAINILKKFSTFNEYWTPKILTELNGQLIKIAKLKGEFVWHSHENEDELFQIIKGTLYIKLRDKTVTVKEGELFMVPKGVEHFPFTEKDEEVWVMLFEPRETKHTGNVVVEKTVTNPEWI